MVTYPYGGMRWYPHACTVCGGDLHDDLDEPGWAMCFMCARSFRLSELSTIKIPELSKFSFNLPFRGQEPQGLRDNHE